MADCRFSIPGARRAAVLMALGLLAASAHAADPAHYIRKDTWQETMLVSRTALMASQKEAEKKGVNPTFATGVMLGGDAPQNIKVKIAGWKDLYLIVDDAGDYSHDVANWAEAKLIAKDGSVTWLDTVEPSAAQQGWGTFRRDNKSTVGGPMQIADRKFSRGVGTHAISVIQYLLEEKYEYLEAWVGVDASRGKGQGSVRFIVSNVKKAAKGHGADAELWTLVARDFSAAAARRQIAWEKEDRIWDNDWTELAEVGQRYAKAAHGLLAVQAEKLAGAVKDPASLQAVREIYYRSRDAAAAAALLKGLNFQALRLAITDLTATFGSQYPKGAEHLARVEELEKAAAGLAAGGAKSADPQVLAQLSQQARTVLQDALLSNPLLDFDKLLLVKRAQARMGLPQNWQSNSCLPKVGYDNEIAVLSPAGPAGQMTTLYKPDGGKFVGDVDVHFDGERMLFSSIGTNGRWQVFEIGVDGKGLRQVTPGDQPDVDSYDACYLPNGKIVFNSTACFVGVPCVYGSSHVTNLYVMDADGKNIRQLTTDQEHGWCPTVLNNGRVMYLRWEYTDTPHSQTRLLFHMNPDGTEQAEYYGSNSYWPNGVFYARPIPEQPTKVVGIVTGHHGVPRMGELVVLDPARSRFEADGAVQRIPGYGKKVEPKIADALVDGSWPKFLHPYPLSEKYFLVAAQPTHSSLWGIYLVDVFDNMLLLAEMPGYALLEPVPLRKTKTPPLVPEKADPRCKDATLYISDIYQGEGMKGVPRGTVKQLRIFSYHFAYQGMGGLLGVIGMDGPWDIRRIMGTVPVEADGSAKFRIPANTPISMQPLDAEGKAVQIMRSWTTAMPGENLSCVGCHERQNSAPTNSKALAFARDASEIKPWYGPTRGFSYLREVQPVIDRYCVGCHDGKTPYDGKTPCDLRGTERIKDFRMETAGNGGGNAGKFTVGYAELHRFVRRPGIESDYHVLTPCEFHADTTQLAQMLNKGHYNVKLDPESWDRLVTWMDLNAPYHGTWHEELAKPGNQRKRRMELRKLYAGVEEDPEEVIASAKPPEKPVTPEPLPKTAVAAPECPGWPFDAAEATKRQTAAGTLGKQTFDLGDGIKMELVLVPAGEFVMGDANGEVDERPLTRVRIDKPFWMGACEVTNQQYLQFDPAHDSHVISKQAYQFGVHGFPADEPQQPVVRVSWERAMAFCAWLSGKTGKQVSLPTEAQWEYACRAGAATPLFYGDLNADFSKFANVADAKLKQFASNPYTVFEPLHNPSKYEDYIPKDMRFNDGGLVTVKVGTYQSNAWGLCDMHGNAAEWTRTVYKAYPYRDDDGRSVGASGPKPQASSLFVVRGGSWRDRPAFCRSAFRLSYPAWQRVYNVGFRVMAEEK